jgi:hypothetical protein
MSLKSRARRVQRATGMPYQKCLQGILTAGRAVLKVRARTGWSMDECDLFLANAHTDAEYLTLGITKEDLTP